MEIDQGDIYVKKLDHLQDLVLLKCKEEVNINAVGTMASLRTLELSLSDSYVLEGLQQFPNLEKLMISDAGKGSFLGRLEKLKVLYVSGDALDNSEMFRQLPQLEKLEICCVTLSADIGQLRNLKLLDLNEVRELKNISEIAKLKWLERVSLDKMQPEDAKVFNDLPHLEQLNISGYPVDDIGIKQQLDQPEILTLLGGPYIAFSVWESNDLKL